VSRKLHGRRSRSEPGSIACFPEPQVASVQQTEPRSVYYYERRASARGQRLRPRVIRSGSVNFLELDESGPYRASSSFMRTRQFWNCRAEVEALAQAGILLGTPGLAMVYWSGESRIFSPIGLATKAVDREKEGTDGVRLSVRTAGRKRLARDRIDSVREGLQDQNLPVRIHLV